MENYNIYDLIKPQKVCNKVYNFDTEDYESCFTTDKIYLPSEDDINSKDYVLSRKTFTDFVALDFDFPSNKFIILSNDKKLIAPYKLLTNKKSIPQYFTGMIYRTEAGDNYGYAPKMTIKLPYPMTMQEISQKIGKIENRHYDKTKIYSKDIDFDIINLGSYPKNRAKKLNATLEDLFNNGNPKKGLTCTGILYTKRGEEGPFLSRLIPEFEYKGKRYVRYSNAFINENDSRKFSDGQYVKNESDVQWLNVEPISFIINKTVKNSDNKIVELELESEDVILNSTVNLRNYADYYNLVWQCSEERAFLNSTKTSLLDGEKRFKFFTNYDFTQNGFLYQAFDLERKPQKTYIIPENETAICKNAFEGCLGIEKIVIHPGVKSIAENAFDNCDFSFLYKDEASNEIILSKKPINDIKTSIFIDINKFSRCLNGILIKDLVNFVRNGSFEIIKALVNKLDKNKVSLPYCFVRHLLEHDKLESFVNNSEFKFIKGESLLTNLPKDVLDETLIGYMKFLTAIGCFSKDKIIDKFGEETEVYLAQKAVSFMAKLFNDRKVNIYDFECYTKLNNFDANQDLLQTLRISSDGQTNLEYLFKLERSCPNISCKVAENLPRLKTFRKAISDEGMPIVIGWKDAIKNFYINNSYASVKEEDQDMAFRYANMGIAEDVFLKASNSRRQAKEKGIREHILNAPLKEKTILEQVEEIKAKTQEFLDEGRKLLQQAYKKQFTYEMLSKYDPDNAILGLYCTCCAVINSKNYGHLIAESSIGQNDVQNLVIRNRQGVIVAKGTMYVNEQKGYIVFNDFEVNEKYRKYVNSLNKSEIADKNAIFDALLRGIHDFVQKYDLQHPDNPIQQVNVGMGHNRLKPQCERFKSEDNLLHVPKSYGFADAKDEQRILYKRHERKKVLKGEREDENDIRPD